MRFSKERDIIYLYTINKLHIYIGESESFICLLPQNLCFESLKKTEYRYEQKTIISGLYYKPCMGVKVWAAQLIFSQTFYHCFINAIAVMSFKALGDNSILLQLLVS